MEPAMRVPTIDYRDATIAEQEQEQPSLAVTRIIIATGVCISLLVWALAIAKIIDLCNFQ
jgi:hypothetical protein